MAAKYLMVIGGSSASPSFAALDRERGSLPLCLRRSFRPIWGPQQYSYKPPLVALPGGNNNNSTEISTNLEFSLHFRRSADALRIQDQQRKLLRVRHSSRSVAEERSHVFSRVCDPNEAIICSETKLLYRVGLEV